MLDNPTNDPRVIIRSMVNAGSDADKIAKQIPGGEVVDSLFTPGRKAIRIGSTTYELLPVRQP